MSQTVKITIPVEDELVKDELIARLSEIQFDAFEESLNELSAFIREENFVQEAMEKVLLEYKKSYGMSLIEEQNWNELWESNFEPVVVEDFCMIRAEFHSKSNTEYEIVITPKMSFGTGHHATTYMMISEMRKLNFKDKSAIDFGTGTGVLAILAEKLGAKSIVAIDNDDWSIENSRENIARNGCQNITIEKADYFHTNRVFDIILANINKSIILSNVSNLVAASAKGSQILLSGLLKEDEPDIVHAFVEEGLTHLLTTERNNWICILLRRD